MNIFISVIIAGVGIGIGFYLRNLVSSKKIESAEKKAKEILEFADKQIETRKRELEVEAKDQLYKIRQDFDKETKDRQDALSNQEKRISQKEENVERRLNLLEKKDKDIEEKLKNLISQEDALKTKTKNLDQLITEEKERLHKISNLSPAEARQVLLKRISEELNIEKAQLIKKMEDEIKETGDKKAKEVISLAIQKCSADYTAESTVTVVNLPSDEMKGRIIGREGRNIRALEMATGVDVIIDDTPGAVTLSAFNTVRREIARMSLEKLIGDGRIHPGRIEEVVEKTKKEMDEKIKEEGQTAIFDLGLHGLHPELITLLGRLKYRTSFGQNVLQHSKEVAYLMGAMASELELNARLARRIGLLHDIGKSIDRQVEGTHAHLGAELAKKFGEPFEVIHAIEAHHEEIETKNIYAILAAAADAVSASRPGARRETLETYIKRLEKLEAIANEFKGVDKTYAIQAGREIRVIVHADKVNDSDCLVLAQDIRKKIEEGMEYPGQIKVTVIREIRAIEYAK